MTLLSLVTCSPARSMSLIRMRWGQRCSNWLWCRILSCSNSPSAHLRALARNRECVERVTWSTKTERVRALELGLLDPVFCKQLGEFFSRIGVSNPKEWTQAIVRDRVNWPLAFNKWLFEDGGVNPDAIYIGDVELPDLPLVKDDNEDPRLAELIGHRVLPISKTGLKKFSVSFQR